MSCTYIVRYGLHGKIREAAPREPTAYERGERVVVETERGVELGELLGPMTQLPEEDPEQSPHEILRAASPADLERATALEARRTALYDEWSRETAASGLAVELVDVEELLEDGRVVFYVLAEPGDALVHLSQLLAVRLPDGFKLENLAADAMAGAAEGAGVRKCGSCGSGQCHAPDDFERSAEAWMAQDSPAQANGAE